jgi:hypothetical protein
MAFDPDPAAVLFNDLLDRDQSYAAAFELVSRMQPLEKANNLPEYFISKPTPLSFI